MLFAFSSSLLAASAALASPGGACFVAFAGEPPVLASSADLPGKQRSLAANSQKWLDNAGSRIEIGPADPRGGPRPAIAYAHRMEAITARNAKGEPVQVAVVATGKMHFELSPGKPALAKDPDGADIAWVLCSAQE